MSETSTKSKISIDLYFSTVTRMDRIGLFLLSFVLVLFGWTGWFYILTDGNPSNASALNPIYAFVIGVVWFAYPILVASMGFALVKIIFRKVGHLNYLKFEDYVKMFGYALSLMFIASIIGRNLYGIIIVLFVLPMFLVFSSNLSFEGKTRIEVEQVYTNLNDYEKRQEWLLLIFKKLEDKLKLGRIDVSNDSLAHYVNLSIETGKSQNYLRDIFDWICGDRRDSLKIINVLTQVVPNTEIKKLTKPPTIPIILSWIDKNKNFVSIVIIILFLILSPPEWKDIVLQLFKAFRV